MRQREREEALAVVPLLSTQLFPCVPSRCRGNPGRGKWETRQEGAKRQLLWHVRWRLRHGMQSNCASRVTSCKWQLSFLPAAQRCRFIAASRFLRIIYGMRLQSANNSQAKLMKKECTLEQQKTIYISSSVRLARDHHYIFFQRNHFSHC